MNSKRKNYPVVMLDTVVTVVISSLLILTVSFGGTMIFQTTSGAITQEFNLLQNHIDQAQEEALKDEHTRALEELSAAQSELLKITQRLPSSQE